MRHGPAGDVTRLGLARDKDAPADTRVSRLPRWTLMNPPRDDEGRRSTPSLRSAALHTLKALPWLFFIAAVPALVEGPRTVRSLGSAFALAVAFSPIAFGLFVLGGWLAGAARRRKGPGA